jgi:hypothetical protein
MGKLVITFADQEIANRIAIRHHLLKDIEVMMDWDRIRNILSQVEIKLHSVAGRDAFPS